jgi:transcription elongation factor GreA
LKAAAPLRASHGGAARLFLWIPLGARTMSDRVYMTREAYNRKVEEVKRMEIQLGEIAEQMADARAEGDLKENAEYHGQREAHGQLQAKINQRKSELSRAEIYDPSTLPRDQVRIGATVRVMDLDLEEEEEITLVGSGDEDYDRGRYLVTSPLGQGLVGKKIGDKVAIPVPRGKLNFEILEIRFDEE